MKCQIHDKHTEMFEYGFSKPEAQKTKIRVKFGVDLIRYELLLTPLLLLLLLLLFSLKSPQHAHIHNFDCTKTETAEFFGQFSSGYCLTVSQKQSNAINQGRETHKVSHVQSTGVAGAK